MFWLLLAVVQPGFSVKIDKCCPSGRSIGADTITCFPSGSITNTSDILPQDALLEHTDHPCPLDKSDFIRFDEEEVEIISGSLVIEPGPDNITYPPSTFCVDYMFPGPVQVARMCPCSIATCVRKCCHHDRILNVSNALDASCVDVENSTTWKPNLATKDALYYTLHGFPKCHGTGLYLLNNDPAKPHVTYVVQDNGEVKLSNSETVIHMDNYCIEMTLHNDIEMENLLICLTRSHTRTYVQGIIYSILLVIGSLFLFMTLLVQYSMSELRKTLHSKNLTSHTLSLLIGYIIITIQSLGYTPSSSIVCIILGYLTQFSFLAAFFWLNVMCVDITWTFSGFRIPEGSSINESEEKKFAYYSAYSWGSTLIIVLITVITDTFSDGTSISPDLGAQKCWFSSKLATLVFFYLPISLLLLLNVFLFVYTSYTILKVRRATVMMLRQDGMRPSCSNFNRFSEFRFTLYLKLSMLMGIAWIFEVIAWAVDEDENYYYIYIITDAINALRGVFVFFLFCRKRKLMEIVRSKLKSARGIKLRKGKTKNSSTKSSPGDSSTLYTSNQTHQTNAE